MTYATDPAVVELGSDNTIILPAAIAQQFHPADCFVVFPDGDTLILKRIVLPNVLAAVANAEDDESPLTMAEIDDIVHQVRRGHMQE